MSGPLLKVSERLTERHTLSETSHSPNSSTPYLAVLGADTVIEALPATPIQLLHACQAAGFAAAIPVSWGDELVAFESARRAQTSDRPAVHCSCPIVSARLARHDGIGNGARTLASPPVAVARYLRALHAPTPVHITFIGRCPGAHDVSIDEWLRPEELHARFARRSIVVTEQPPFFDSVLPPDRRRYYSRPGGAPTAASLHDLAAVPLIEPSGSEAAVEIAQALLSGTRALIDPAAAFGCLCAGAGASGAAPHDRDALAAHEPPRSTGSVVDTQLAVSLEAPPAPSYPSATPSVPADMRRPDGSDTIAVDSPRVVIDTVRRTPPRSTARQSPPGGVRQVGGAAPFSRDADGRQLPRTYVARRRSPREVRNAEVERLALDSGPGSTATPPRAATALPHTPPGVTPGAMPLPTMGERLVPLRIVAALLTGVGVVGALVGYYLR